MVHDGIVKLMTFGKVTTSHLIFNHCVAHCLIVDPANCPVSDDGVLQGYGVLTPLDARDSNLFLDCLVAKHPSMRFDRVADCGAGIGRVTKHLLLSRFGLVDLVEQVSISLLQFVLNHA